MINIIRTLLLFIGLYLLIFSIVLILIPNIDVLIKFALIIILFVIWKANEKLMNFIYFFSAKWKILALSMLSVILGLGEIYLILKIFDFIALNSKYLDNIEMTNENTATFLLVILILWYYLSYISFKICISSLEKITIKQIKILELNSTHFKLLEA